MKIIKLKYILATGFGVGYAPYVPGSVGSLVALLLYILIPLDDIIWLIISIALSRAVAANLYIKIKVISVGSGQTGAGGQGSAIFPVYSAAMCGHLVLALPCVIS